MQRLLRIRDWPFGVKIGVALVALAILPMAITSTLLSINAANALRNSAFRSLEAVGASRLDAIESYLGERVFDVRTFASHPSTVQAFLELGQAMRDIGTDKARDLYLGQSELALHRTHIKQQGVCLLGATA